MISRRKFVKSLLAAGGGVYTFLCGIGTGIQQVLAAAVRRLVPKGTPMSELMYDNPAKLDTSQLETTPLEDFDVMGETFLEVDITEWRLEVKGAVRQPKSYTYADLLKREAIERNVLLICEGFFAYNGLWKGFSVAALLQELGLQEGASKVTFSGSTGFRRKSRTYRLDEVLADKIFIAYGVNSIDLPKRHGFPMRLVADGHLGKKWVKYLNTVTVV